MSVKPITPQEAHEKFCETQIPDFVIEVINDLISRESSQPNRSVDIKQNEIIEKIIKHPDFPKDTSRQDIFDKYWLNFETIYEKAGWKVKYDKPGYNETYDAFYTFTPKHS